MQIIEFVWIVSNSSTCLIHPFHAYNVIIDLLGDRNDSNYIYKQLTGGNMIASYSYSYYTVLSDVAVALAPDISILYCNLIITS